MSTVPCSDCGQLLELRFRFCPTCGSPAPPLPDVVGTVALRRPAFEAALLHALRDIDDGHLGLWGRPDAIALDRGVGPILGDTQDWVDLLVYRGWIEPDRASGRARLISSARGRSVLAEAGLRPAAGGDFGH